MGSNCFPIQKTKKRKATTKSKFYFFDCGVANYFSRRLPLPENSTDIGINFEQFIINEVRAYLSYKRIKKDIHYWRSKDHEVDLVIGHDVAIEIKYSKNFKLEFIKGLRALKEEKIFKRYIIVGRFSSAGVVEENLGYSSPPYG